MAWFLAASYQRNPHLDPEHLINAVMVLCRATKNTDADDLKNLVYNRRMAAKKNPTQKLEIPDYALDAHTKRGKAMGRGNAHWYSLRDTFLEGKGPYHQKLEQEFPGFVGKEVTQ